MSADNELPALVTPDAIIRRLNLEIDGYRLREQVAKQANEKMRAELDTAVALTSVQSELLLKRRADLAARDVLIGELRECIERTRGDIHSPGMEELVEEVLARTADLPQAGKEGA